MDLSQIRSELRRRAETPVPKRLTKRGVRLILLSLLALRVFVALIPVGFRVTASFCEVHVASDLAPEQGQFVATRTGRIFVQQAGPADGVPVIIIHGTAAWSGLWRDTMEKLAERGLRVTALDMPPFGFSDRAYPPDYSRAAQAERISGVLEAPGIESADLAGHSFGAGPTVETVLRYPRKVRGLVLVAGVLGVCLSTIDSLNAERVAEGGAGTIPVTPLELRHLVGAYRAPNSSAARARSRLSY